jgi:transposase-like protein
MRRSKQPLTPLLGLVRNFRSEKECIAYLEKLRWPEGLTCIRCGSTRVLVFNIRGRNRKGRHLYQCAVCRYQFSVTAGTVFHDSHLPLKKWFRAVVMVNSANEDLSAKELQRQLDTTYKTAWYMLRRIRLLQQATIVLGGRFKRLDLFE